MDGCQIADIAKWILYRSLLFNSVLLSQVSTLVPISGENKDAGHKLRMPYGGNEEEKTFIF